MSDFASATVQGGAGDVLPVSHGDDKAFQVEFYTREVEDEKETKLKGRRILKPVPYCRKRAMGDPRTVWDAPVSEADKMRWPMLWQAYERGEEEMVIGTPLDSWPLLTREARITLKNWGYKTVDQVAEVTDGALMGMADGQIRQILAQVREHAKKFIKDQESGEVERRLAGQLEERDNEIALLKGQMATLAAQMERMNAEKLAAPVTPPIESAPGFQPMQPKEPEIDPVRAFSGLPTLEAAESEPEPVPIDAPHPEPHPARKISPQQAAEIRASDEPVADLAERYDVSLATIRKYRK